MTMKIHLGNLTIGVTLKFAFSNECHNDPFTNGDKDHDQGPVINEDSTDQEVLNLWDRWKLPAVEINRWMDDGGAGDDPY